MYFLSLRFFFLCGPFLKSLICCNIVSVWVLDFGPGGMWDLSFLTRDQTCTLPPTLEGEVSTTGLPGKSLIHFPKWVRNSWGLIQHILWVYVDLEVCRTGKYLFSCSLKQNTGREVWLWNPGRYLKRVEDLRGSLKVTMRLSFQG